MERGKEIKTEEKITSYLNEQDEIVIGGLLRSINHDIHHASEELLL